MALCETDREDLLREATALVERIELDVAGFDQPIVAGFRRSGAVSLYFGADPVFQFNDRGAWRRGFRDGDLLKADRGNIVRLQRKRQASQVQLLRTDFHQPQAASYTQFAQQHLMRLSDLLAAGKYKVIGQEPADRDVLGRLQQWLEGRDGPIEVADAPNVIA